MAQPEDRFYFASRAAEEAERATEAVDANASLAHRKLQRAFMERALVGDRPETEPDRVH